MKISLIVAASENNVIGRDNDLPWQLPDDLQFFRKTTAGHPIIMGRKNYESIGRPLPKRTNIIVTRQSDYAAEGCIVTSSLEEAISIAKKHDYEEVFIIGGGEIYRQSLSLVDRMYITRVHATIDGDVYFPEVDTSIWNLSFKEKHEADEKHNYAFTFMVFDRK